jgi:hypothetical protein
MIDSPIAEQAHHEGHKEHEVSQRKAKALHDVFLAQVRASLPFFVVLRVLCALRGAY